MTAELIDGTTVARQALQQTAEVERRTGHRHDLPLPHRNLQRIVETGDIVGAAVRRPELIRGDWIKPGAGRLGRRLQRRQRRRRPTSRRRRTSAAPHPSAGGVGPMTIAMLLSQTVDAAERRR